jgi:hypothetical protein
MKVFLVCPRCSTETLEPDLSNVSRYYDGDSGCVWCAVCKRNVVWEFHAKTLRPGRSFQWIDAP